MTTKNSSNFDGNKNKYPEDYEKVFRDHYKPIQDLPILDLKERQGGTDYIDFLKTDEMTSPVMRFVDKFNRLGIALHLRCEWGHWKNKEIVLALFQRYTDDPNTWTYGWGGSQDFLHNTYFKYHRGDHKNKLILACENCPITGSRITTHLLRGIFTGTDKVSSLRRSNINFSKVNNNDMQKNSEIIENKSIFRL